MCVFFHFVPMVNNHVSPAFGIGEYFFGKTSKHANPRTPFIGAIGFPSEIPCIYPLVNWPGNGNPPFPIGNIYLQMLDCCCYVSLPEGSRPLRVGVCWLHLLVWLVPGLTLHDTWLVFGMWNLTGVFQGSSPYSRALGRILKWPIGVSQYLKSLQNRERFGTTSRVLSTF